MKMIFWARKLFYYGHDTEVELNLVHSEIGLAAIISVNRILSKIQYTKRQIIQWLFNNQHPGTFGALAYDIQQWPTPLNTDTSSKSILDSIFEPILRAVPKNRRSLERRLSRKHGLMGHFEAAIPKKNIVACLDCGQWHERETICGHCYEKVKQETKELKALMGDDFQYNAPRTEIAVVYEGEARNHGDSKYFIEVEKPRPQWFPKNLLTPAKKDS